MIDEVERNSVRRRLEAIGSVSSSDFATTQRDLAEQGSGEGMPEIRDTAVCVAGAQWDRRRSD
jgi:hypothetical protein